MPGGMSATAGLSTVPDGTTSTSMTYSIATNTPDGDHRLRTAGTTESGLYTAEEDFSIVVRRAGVGPLTMTTPASVTIREETSVPMVITVDRQGVTGTLTVQTILPGWILGNLGASNVQIPDGQSTATVNVTQQFRAGRQAAHLVVRVWQGTNLNENTGTILASATVPLLCEPLLTARCGDARWAIFNTGTSALVRLTAHRPPGYTGDVTVSFNSLPTGVTCSHQSPFTIPSGQTTAEVTFSAANGMLSTGWMV